MAAGTGEEAGMSFAERMMKNMGWTQGKGLGRDEEGMKDFIKPKMKFNTKGIGFMGVDNKWIAHQEHFDDLLTSLNKGEKPAEKKDIACLTSASKLRGRTKFYAKMMRGKDLSNRSSKDLSSIILPLSKKDVVEKPETATLPSEVDGTLKSSQVSMKDYFAQIMAQRKSNVNGDQCSTSENSQDSLPDEQRKDLPGEKEADEKKKKRKREKKNKQDRIPEESSPSHEVESVVEDAGVKRKTKRKSADYVEQRESSGADIVFADSLEPEEENSRTKSSARKQKRSKTEGVIRVDERGDMTEGRKVKKSKKQKEVAEEVLDDSPEVEAPVQKKKKKKNKDVETKEFAGNDGDQGVSAEPGGDFEQPKKIKKTKSKHKETETEFEVSEYGERLSLDVNLLKKIRGPELAKSKAEPLLDLTDEQIQDIYNMWTSGGYAEFMRKVHSGELPRWVAIGEYQLKRMTMGRATLLNLADVRAIVKSKWKGANVEDIWGYTNVAYLAV